MRALFFFTLVAVFILIILFRSFLILEETVQTLFTFNLLFLLILMPLKGSLKRKVAILLLGNILSFIWSTLFYSFVHLAIAYADGLLNSLYVILSPLLNVFWVVVFWSTSLTFLAEQKKENGAKLDN